MSKSALVLLALCASAAAYSLHAPCHAANRRAAIAMQETTRGLDALTQPQQKAFLAVMADDEFPMSNFVTADAELWDKVRAIQPDLAELSDAELQGTFDTYISTSPKLSEVLLKTPVGPVIGINLLFAVTGFSFCDLPFADQGSAACVQLAARQAAGM